MQWIENMSEILESTLGISPTYGKLIIISLLSIVVVKIIKEISYSFYMARHQDAKERYYYNKKLQLIYTILNVVLLAIIWEAHLKNFMTFLTFFSAGVAIAVREIILNFFAGIYIRMNKPFTVEDRIEIENLKGDVVNINATNFELLEIGDRVQGEQSTGRIVHVPNSIIFRSPLKNYVKAFKYIWTELTVKVELDSDLRKTKEALYKIVKKNNVISEIPQKMETQVSRASDEYRIYFNNLDPIIYTEIVDSHIALYIRYLVHPKKARNVENLIWQDILKLYQNRKILLYRC